MRAPTHGTPDRTAAYVFPAGTGRRVYRTSLLAGGGLALAMAVLHLAGLKRVASPGPVTSGHAAFEASCESCHVRARADDLRCERCHDPSSGEGLRLAAHGAFGREVSAFTPDSSKAIRAASGAELPCARCHDDHRGRDFKPAALDDRYCTACHAAETPSLAGHVEFALVRAKATPPRGLKISHGRHVLEAYARIKGKASAKELSAGEAADAQKGSALSRTCETCHVASADLAGFLPVDFDRHCASCHEKDGSVGATDPVPAGDVVSAADARARWSAAVASHFVTGRGSRVAKSAVLHRDPWVLLNLAKLRRELDPAGAVADRARLWVKAASTSAGPIAPLSRLSDDDLAARRTSLEADVRELVRRQSLPHGDPQDRTALTESGVFAALGDADAGAALGAAALRARTEPLARLSPDESAARRAELLAALDAVRPRVLGNLVLLRKTDALRRRVLAWRGWAAEDGLPEAVASARLELARLEDELDLRAHRTAPLPVPAVGRRRGPSGTDDAAERALRDLASLAAADAFVRPGLDEASRASRRETATALLAPCVKCHQTAVASLAPLAVEEPVLPRSFFDHKPHVRTRSCGQCHGESGKGVTASKSELDVLVPDVASCRTCHRPSETRADCLTCHRFHPGPGRF